MTDVSCPDNVRALLSPSDRGTVYPWGLWGPDCFLDTDRLTRIAKIVRGR